MKRLQYHSAQERLNDYLKEKGLRPSVVRDYVLEQACELPQPFTARQLETVCKGERISVGTVYNSLNVFVDAGILHVIERQRGRTAMEYELVPNAVTHMQYICQNCGRTVEFNDKAIARLIRERKYTNFNVQHFTLLVYGECKICRTKVKKVQA